MIKKMMSLLKIGSPRVDLVLKKHKLKRGESVTGAFYIEGGWVKQNIRRLECDLVKVFQGEVVETVDAVTTILMSHDIDAEGKTEFPFSYQLPVHLEPTNDFITYRLNTRLILEDDMNTFDHDEIVILKQKQKVKK
ncbi:Sporulation-control protein spo0M [Bacillus sp. THAF10]|nr:Sporulation-control protein spo0M [Bacillus sp. THAF10]